MERNKTQKKSLSLSDIKAYLENKVSAAKKVEFDQHFATDKLSAEVKDSFSTVNELGVEEDIEELKDAIFDTINRRTTTNRRLLLTKIAAGILLPLLGIATFLYVNRNTADRLFADNFQAYKIPDMTMRGKATVDTYDQVILPKDFQAAIDEYSAGDYQASLPHFQNYYEKQPTNNYANFLHGVAQLAVNDADQAIYFLEKVGVDDSNFSEDVTCYLALAHLKQKNKTTAKQLLSKLINGTPYYSNKAKTLKNKL
ncbi:MAG: hypothetical protein AAGJ18_00750 [Bacteroidota bacterium]